VQDRLNIPQELKYSEDHVWVRVDGHRAVVGMTQFAQQELGDIVFVELPAVGDTIAAGDPLGSVESVKTVSELYAPVSGRIVEVNEALGDAPEKVNESPYGDGWMVVIEMSDVSELDKLWPAEKYKQTYSEG
jgi:glycine cleavage system H protein